MKYFIKNIEYYLPEKIITNSFLADKCGIDKEFLENKIGIRERRIAGSNESITDMAEHAVRNLLVNTNTKPDEVDMLILCTQNPDYKLPSTSCIIQSRLNIKKESIVFDVNLGCSGFIYLLEIAGKFLISGSVKKAIIIMADQYSKVINYSDKNTASLFGDAASAALLEACEDDFGVIDFEGGSDGSGAEHLIVNNSGVVKNPEKDNFLYMNGREIFKFSISIVPETVNTILRRNNLQKNDIKYFIFHQANKYMLNEIKKKLNISDEQMIIDMEKVGNTVSSTIPIALKNLLLDNKLKKGDLIILCGFGVGLSWGAILYKHI